MNTYKKIIYFLVLSVVAVGSAVCAAPKTAKDVGKSFSPAVLQYNTWYDLNDYTKASKDLYALEGCISSREARAQLEKIATDIEKLSEAVLEDDVLKAKTAERDAKAAELEGASKAKKFFKEDEVKKLTSEIETSISNKAKIEKLAAKIEPLTKQYTAALEFEKEMEPYIKETLENVAGFQFADDEKILAATKKALDKREKKEKRQRNWQSVKNIFNSLDRLSRGGSIKNANSAFVSTFDLMLSALDDGKSDDDPKTYLVINGYNEDMRKALKSASKAKSFVRVYFRVRTQKYDDKPLEGEAKRYSQTVCASAMIVILNEKGKIEKGVEGYVKSAIQSQEKTKENPDTLLSQVPELMKSSLEYAASNFHVTDKRKKSPGRMQREVFKDVTVMTQKKWDNNEFWFF